MWPVQENTVVYPPNKCLQRSNDLSTTPVIYDHLLFLDINDKGEAIVGSSNLNGTLWEGTLLYFSDEESLQHLKYQKSFIGATVSDGKFLNDTTIVLAEDTGILNVLSISKDSNRLVSSNYFRHTDRVPRLAVWNNTSQVLTSSDNAVVVWDINSMARRPIHFYPNFHTHPVNDIDTHKKDSRLFVSVSMDKKCCIWDNRESSPASVLYENEFSSLTSVAWNHNNTNYIAVGTQGGDVYLLDKREPKEFISVANCNCPIHRVLFGESNKLAVCGDSNEVIVFKCDDEVLNNVCSNDKHSGIIRGLAWYNESLYSCGFDKQVVKHLL